MKPSMLKILDTDGAFLCQYKIDGFVKSPASVLHCILRHCGVALVRLIPQDLRALNLELFTLPSNLDFLQNHQIYAAQRALDNVHKSAIPFTD